MIMLTAVQQLSSQNPRPVYIGNNSVIIQRGETLDEIVEKAAAISPSASQLEWQRLEFTAFVHFGINTFTGREWGDGKDDPALDVPSYNAAVLDVVPLVPSMLTVLK